VTRFSRRGDARPGVTSEEGDVSSLLLLLVMLVLGEVVTSGGGSSLLLLHAAAAAARFGVLQLRPPPFPGLPHSAVLSACGSG